MKIYRKNYTISDEQRSTVKTDKKQIVLANTFAKLKDHLNYIGLRVNGKNQKCPTFTIGLNGKIYQHYHTDYYTNFLGRDIDINLISIALENEGWLVKSSDRNIFFDWSGRIYERDKPLELSWRGYFYWSNYSENQLLSLDFLLNKLCDEHTIEKKFTGHGGKVEEVYKFDGITCRSNYFEEYSDLNPSFDFGFLREKYPLFG